MRGVLVLGEALTDVVVDADGQPVGEHPGGSPMNVALGLARLGQEAHLLTWYGRDARGEAIRTHLERSGVHVVEGSDGAARTSTATARLDGAGVATYDFDLDYRVPDVPLPQAPLAVHTGSIAAFLMPGAATVERVVMGAHGRTTVTYDPNARPTLMGDAVAARSRVESLVAASDVVKVSDEDLAWLCPGQEPEAVAASWLALGPAVVVVTLGGSGAVAVARSGRVAVRAPSVDVVDTVGAGDAFMSGLLDALARADLLGGDRRAVLREVSGQRLTEVLRHAVRVAAFTCTRAGAQPPSREELDAWRPAP